MNSSKRLAFVVVVVTSFLVATGVSADSKTSTAAAAPSETTSTTTSTTTTTAAAKKDASLESLQEAPKIDKTIDHAAKLGEELAAEAPSKAAAAVADPLPTTHAPLAAAANKVGSSAAAATTTTTTTSVSHDKSTTASNATAPAKLVEPLLQTPTTVAPTAAAAAPATTAAPVVRPLPLLVPITVEDRLVEYFEPICGAFESINPKQLFKIQSQLKQFVEKTAGKLSVCFMRSFKIDPNLEPVSKPNLAKICASTKLKPEDVGSFKMFTECAGQHWDPTLNGELEKIHLARSNCVKNHGHSKNDTAASLIHDSLVDEGLDELSLIGDVVSKVLDNPSSIVNKSDIKVIDMSSSSSAKVSAPGATSAPASGASGHITTTVSPAAQSANTKALLNDPNTVLVFVDEPSASKTSTAKPVVSLGNSTKVVAAAATTASPELSTASVDLTPNKNTTSTATTTTVSSTTSGGASSAKTTTTAKPIVEAVKTTAKASVTSLVTKVEGASTSKPAGSTRAPVAKLAAAAAATTTTLAPKAIEKPLGTLQELLMRQEREKQEFESRLKLEREKILKQLQKRQDEIDAKNAMKALQVQRARTGEHSDAKLHQIEHERQMSIDPIGHTIKHQQYELSKQQKAG